MNKRSAVFLSTFAELCKCQAKETPAEIQMKVATLSIITAKLVRTSNSLKRFISSIFK
jgi:hypothetical protein